MEYLYLNKIFNITPPWKRGLGGLKNNTINPPSPLFKKGGIFYLLILFLITSCSNPYKNLTTTELKVSEAQKIPYSLPFIERTVIYKTDIQFYKNDISGLLIIKQTEDRVFRIALTTQFGLKIFDFELDHGNLNVKYCIEYLNKKIILNTFQTDFNLLLIQSPFDSVNLIDNTDQNQKIWRLSLGKIHHDYIQNNSSQQIEGIYFRKRNSEKISVGLHKYKTDIPSKISLQHHNIKLRMNLKFIK